MASLTRPPRRSAVAKSGRSFQVPSSSLPTRLCLRPPNPQPGANRLFKKKGQNRDNEQAAQTQNADNHGVAAGSQSLENCQDCAVHGGLIEIYRVAGFTQEHDRSGSEE